MKKLLLIFLSSLIIFISIVPNFLVAKAANPPTPTAAPEGTWYNQSFNQWYNKVYDSTNPSEIFGERYTAAQVQWVVYSLMAFIVNSSLGNSSKSQDAVACFLTASGDVNTCLDAIRGLITSSNQVSPVAEKQQDLLSLVFADRPLSGITYVKNKVESFSLTPTAYAATTPGFGFDVLSPVQDMWKASRDISFGLFVLAAIVFAFMVMFRVKISPQVVISVQSAIPKLLIALVLVTFSYAIAGFLVDLMYVVIGIFSIILPQFIPQLHITAANAFNLLTGVGSGGSQTGALGLIGYSIFYLFFFILTLVILLAETFSYIVIVIGAGVGTFLTGGLLPLLLILILVIAVIVFIWTMIRTLWMFLKAFVNILLLTMFAPLQITLGTFVSNFGFGNWLKSFISNLAVFVGGGVVMYLALIFLGQAWAKAGIGTAPALGLGLNILFGGGGPANGAGSAYWPPFLGSSNGDAGIGILFLGVSFVLFTLIPKMGEVIQGFVTGKPFAYGSAIGEAIVTPITTAIKVGVTANKVGSELTKEGGFFGRPKAP